VAGLGHVHRLQGRYETAAETYQQVMVIARALGNYGGELVTLVSLGHLHRSQGQYEPPIHLSHQMTERGSADTRLQAAQLARSPVRALEKLGGPSRIGWGPRGCTAVRRRIRYWPYRCAQDIRVTSG
jgi:hypothetical protein